ncbi:alpha/beta hydrolase family protein [Georgenia soli]|uniref:Alpha/beta hydrolase family protein n=1 Tax=Georgenia soli TaxID=638953 RepID=A0A2A9EJY7_9MICO|nr:alpha/beta fold hydrolase [Georgenia soli]PFG38539.1 alpha/beta hydrolase family protein [Georgenia soli]
MSALETADHRRDGHRVLEHRLAVPLDHADPAGERITIFAREIVRDGGEDLPHLLYLQGGPGGRADRPAQLTGWLDRALRDYRVVLLDQRGTGLSTPADALTVTARGDARAQADYLAKFRADAIVDDAERLREALLGGTPWSLLGQSFGGFVITRYLSVAPHAVREALVTGGLPGLTAGAEDVYRRTYALTARRNRQYFARYPGDEASLRLLARHLADTVELLPTGERLTPRRVRQIGIRLGADLGFDALHYVLEDPFVTVGGTRRVSRAVLADVGALLSHATNPLYAVLHEAIYAQGRATRWAAHRLREHVDGFAEDADPADTSIPFFLTGEHVYPWQLREDPALAPLADAADLLAAKDDFPVLYDPEALAADGPPVAAAVYLDDMFVPFDLSMATAEALHDARPWVSNDYAHDGIRTDGARILDRLIALARR